MGDFITSSEVSLSHLKDQCWLLKNVLHDVLKLGVAERVDQVQHRFAAVADNSVRSPHAHARTSSETNAYGMSQCQPRYACKFMHLARQHEAHLARMQVDQHRRCARSCRRRNSWPCRKPQSTSSTSVNRCVRTTASHTVRKRAAVTSNLLTMCGLFPDTLFVPWGTQGALHTDTSGT